jgi:hypothetical protein
MFCTEKALLNQYVDPVAKVLIFARKGARLMTHTGPRLIANDALRKVHSPRMLAVSDRAGFAERELWNIAP